MRKAESCLWSETARCLVVWFREEGRPLFFRQDRDPYRIWILEVMGQQTQLDRAASYLERWLKIFPDLQCLAAAPEERVLKAWEGLGYYSRARNIHKAAQWMVRENGGRLPDTCSGLLTLPGVGEYTAAAIASIAYGEAVPAVDANLLRIFARLFLHEGETSDPAFRVRVQEAVSAMQEVEHPGTVNEGLMELGECVCLLRSPRCALCPLEGCCRAREAGAAERLPLPRRKAPPIRESQAVFFISDKAGRILVEPPAQSGLWTGLWTLPKVVVEGEPVAAALARVCREQLGIAVTVEAILQPVRHSYTRFRLLLYPVRARSAGGRVVTSGEWKAPAALEALPFPSGLRKVLAAL